MDDREKLRRAIEERTREWVEVYSNDPESDALVKSLLLGVESGFRRRTGTLPENERHGPHGIIQRAFVLGMTLAEELPASVITPFCK